MSLQQVAREATVAEYGEEEAERRKAAQTRQAEAALKRYKAATSQPQGSSPQGDVVVPSKINRAQPATPGAHHAETKAADSTAVTSPFLPMLRRFNRYDTEDDAFCVLCEENPPANLVIEGVAMDRAAFGVGRFCSDCCALAKAAIGSAAWQASKDGKDRFIDAEKCKELLRATSTFVTRDFRDKLNTVLLPALLEHTGLVPPEEEEQQTASLRCALKSCLVKEHKVPLNEAVALVEFDMSTGAFLSLRVIAVEHALTVPTFLQLRQTFKAEIAAIKAARKNAKQ